MKLAWILWLSQMLPQPAADSLCLSTTVYLEARDQTLRGQQAVAEVALRRLDSDDLALWGGGRGIGAAPWAALNQIGEGCACSPELVGERKLAQGTGQTHNAA